MMKKRIILFLLISVIVVLSGCAGKDTDKKSAAVEETTDFLGDDFLPTEEEYTAYEYDQRLKYDYDESTETLYIKGEGDMGVRKKEHVKVLEDFPWNYVKNPVHIVIEDGVTSISDCAFSYSSDGNSGNDNNHFNKTKTIKIADSVMKIGNGAFAHDEYLEEVTLSNNLTEMGEWAFLECRSLKKLDIPGSLKIIPDRMCEGCVNLKKITVGNGTKIIDGSAFVGCEELTEVNLPETLEEIKGSAFGDCVKLKEITIPKNVKTIGYFALGYTGEYKKVKDFTIKGVRNSAAEKYAEDGGFKFIALD